jgi:hypothetical protein
VRLRASLNQVSQFRKLSQLRSSKKPPTGGPTLGWLQIPLPFIMPQPQGMTPWTSGLGPPIVAGIMIGLVMVLESRLTQK